MPSSRKPSFVSASLSRRPRLPRRYVSSRFRCAIVLGGAVGFLGVGLRLPLRADTFHWLGGSASGSTLWELFDNWDKGSVPGASDDVVNSTSNVINYLLGAGTSTINTFTNSGGGTFNINLSDAGVQSFTVNGNVNNLLATSIIDITGSNFNTVYFNANGGLLTNEGIIRVHDTGSLYSFADDITNSGTMTSATGALINITQTATLSNSGTVSALLGGSISVFNTSTFNDVNALLNADGSGSVLSIGSLLFTNDGMIQATDGGNVILSDPGLTLTNNNVIQADGTAATSAPIVNLTGDTLTNNANAYIQAIGGNGATTSIDFNTINNNWVLTAADAGSVTNINASTGSATLNNTFAVGAGYGGVLNDYTQTINNDAYLDSMGQPSNYLGYGAFRNGQVYVYGDVNNGINNSTFNNGDVAGSTPGWVHAFSDLADTKTYIRIDPNINNYVGSHITAESVSSGANMPIGAGFQRIDLNLPGTDLYNAGTIEALTGAQVRSHAGTLTNDVGGVITSDGLNAAALAAGNRPNSPYSSTVYLGDKTYNIPTVSNSGTMQVTNGGLLSVNADTLTNKAGGVITSQGADAASGFVSTLILGNYNTNINQITNGGTISAVNGGTTAVNFNTLNNNGSLLANGTGLQSVSTDSNTGGVVSQYTPATLNLNGFNFGTSDALTNTGTIAASGGGQVGTNLFTSLVPFTNQGTISADGVGVFSSTLLPNGDVDIYNNYSSVNIAQGSYYNTNYVGGTLTNGVNGVLSATNGAHLTAFTIGGDIINSGQVMVDGSGILHQTNFAGGGSSASSSSSGLFLNSQAWEFAGDTTGNPTRGGAFLNTGALTASNGTLLAVSANNGLTNMGSIIVHGNNMSAQAHIQLESDIYTSSNHIANGGNIDLTGGSILVDTGGVFSAYAQTNLTQAAAASLTARDSMTTVDLQTDGDISNAGAIDVSSGATLTLDIGGSLTNSNAITTISGGIFNATVQGGFTNSGDIKFSQGALSTNITGGAFVNNGVVVADSGFIIAVNPTSAANTGSLIAQNGGGVTVQNNTVLNNSGTVRAGASSTLTFNGGETQSGASSHTLVDGGGTLKVSGSGLTLGTGTTAGDGGTTSGNGVIVGNIFNVGGVVTPGDNAGTGHLTDTGNYTQGANGAYLVKLGGTGQGTDYDLFSVSGTATLAGKVQVQLSNMFTPFVGETFDVMTYANRVGAFDSLFSLDPGYNYSVTYSANTATLQVLSVAPVPETGTLVSLGLLMAGGAFALRRNRKMG